jgi:hypothetical protein
MDMSAGDFLALFYLLKVPVERINLKASAFNFPDSLQQAYAISPVKAKFERLHL